MNLTGRMETIGAFLKRSREDRGLTLRDVERLTGGKVSNGYLSQIEGGKIESPSVIMLHRLAGVYAIDFNNLCERAIEGNPPLPSPPCCETCGRPLVPELYDEDPHP